MLHGLISVKTIVTLFWKTIRTYSMYILAYRTNFTAKINHWVVIYLVVTFQWSIPKIWLIWTTATLFSHIRSFMLLLQKQTIVSAFHCLYPGFQILTKLNFKSSFFFLNQAHAHSRLKAGCWHTPGLLKLFCEGVCVYLSIYVPMYLCLSVRTHVSKTFKW